MEPPWETPPPPGGPKNPLITNSMHILTSERSETGFGKGGWVFLLLLGLGFWAEKKFAF